MSISKSNPVFQFVSGERKKIRSEGLAYSLDTKTIKNTFDKHVQYLRANGSYLRFAKRDAAEELNFGLRYLAFTLADFGRHRLAFWVGFQLNRYRTKYYRFDHRWGWWLAGLIRSSCTGFLTKPFRVLVPTLVVVVIFAGLFWLLTLLGPGSYMSVELRGNLAGQSPQLVHYLYLSVDSLLKLGHGNVVPRVAATAQIASFLAVALSIAEAISGYVLLGLAFAVGIRRLGTHPYGRMGKWIDDYEAKLARGLRRPRRR